MHYRIEHEERTGVWREVADHGWLSVAVAIGVVHFERTLNTSRVVRSDGGIVWAIRLTEECQVEQWRGYPRDLLPIAQAKQILNHRGPAYACH